MASADDTSVAKFSAEAEITVAAPGWIEKTNNMEDEWKQDTNPITFLR